MRPVCIPNSDPTQANHRYGAHGSRRSESTSACDLQKMALPPWICDAELPSTWLSHPKAGAANLSNEARTAVARLIGGPQTEASGGRDGFHGCLKRRRSNLDTLARSPAPVQRISQCCLSCSICRDHRPAPYQHAPRLTPNVSLEIPSL